MGIVVAIIEFVRVSPTRQIVSTAKLPGLTLYPLHLLIMEETSKIVYCLLYKQVQSATAIIMDTP